MQTEAQTHRSKHTHTQNIESDNYLAIPVLHLTLLTCQVSDLRGQTVCVCTCVSVSLGLRLCVERARGIGLSRCAVAGVTLGCPGDVRLLGQL